jgi:dihydroflavonol-4-reductase
LKRCVFVTGASGLVGSALVPALQQRGANVHALARAGTSRATADVHWHAGDLADPRSLVEALDAVRKTAGSGEFDVVHAAALISYRSRDAALAARVNLDATRVLLDAARASGARRFAFVSSVVAVGVAPDARSEIDEDAPFNGDRRSHYVATKRAAEELVLGARALDVVVVNPGAIYGLGPRPSNTNQFLARIATGHLPPLVPPGSLAVVGVECVADGIVRALERGHTGRRYLLTAENLTVAQLYDRVGRELGVAVPTRIAPAVAWRAVCTGAALWDRLRPLELATPQSLRLLGSHFRFCSARARLELGWAPQPFDRVLKVVLRGMRERGWL